MPPKNRKPTRPGIIAGEGPTKPPGSHVPTPGPKPPKNPPGSPSIPTTPEFPGMPGPFGGPGPVPGGGGGGGGVTPGAFNQGAFDLMMALLKEYGLDSLAGELRKLILNGTTDQASLTLALQDTQEWKRRFAGNELLRRNGLPVLSVAEYLSVERSYAQILKNFGLPTGFYDDPADFAKWIGNSVSANELQQRATMYSDVMKREDPAVLAQLQSMGMGKGDILAYLMDPGRAMPLLQRQYQTTLIGAAARRAGMSSLDNAYLAHLSDLGISEREAAQGYGLIKEGLGTFELLAGIEGDQYSQRDFEGEVFEGNGDAAKKRKRLASRERARFEGESGVGRGSLTQPTGGSF